MIWVKCHVLPAIKINCDGYTELNLYCKKLVFFISSAVILIVII